MLLRKVPPRLGGEDGKLRIALTAATSKNREGKCLQPQRYFARYGFGVSSAFLWGTFQTSDSVAADTFSGSRETFRLANVSFSFPSQTLTSTALATFVCFLSQTTTSNEMKSILPHQTTLLRSCRYVDWLSERRIIGEANGIPSRVRVIVLSVETTDLFAVMIVKAINEFAQDVVNDGRRRVIECRQIQRHGDAVGWMTPGNLRRHRAPADRRATLRSGGANTSR